MSAKNVGIIICSDKCSRGERVDTAGKAIAEIVSSSGYTVADTVIVPDDKQQIIDALNAMCAKNVALVFTTGGTGFSTRDVTPEATKEVIERETNGITQAMCYYGLSVTPRAMLSRAVAGIKGKTLIVNLPGSENAVRENLGFILPSLAHGLEILLDEAHECGGKKA